MSEWKRRNIFKSTLNFKSVWGFECLFKIKPYLNPNHIRLKLSIRIIYFCKCMFKPRLDDAKVLPDDLRVWACLRKNLIWKTARNNEPLLHKKTWPSFSNTYVLPRMTYSWDFFNSYWIGTKYEDAFSAISFNDRGVIMSLGVRCEWPILNQTAFVDKWAVTCQFRMAVRLLYLFILI